MPKPIKRFLVPATALAGALFLTGAANQQAIELEQGQWRVDHRLSVPGTGEVMNETSEFCITEANSTITFDQILAELNFAQCQTSNVVIASGQGSADVVCAYEEDGGVTITGTMEATYSKEDYRVTSRINENGATYVGVGRRTGACSP